MPCRLALTSMRIAADRERAAGEAREEVLARETVAAVYSTADKHAADITARRNGEFATLGWPGTTAWTTRDAGGSVSDPKAKPRPALCEH